MNFKSAFEWLIFFLIIFGVLFHAGYSIYSGEVNIRAFHYTLESNPLKFSLVIGVEVLISSYLIIAHVFKIDLLKRFEKRSIN